MNVRLILLQMFLCIASSGYCYRDGMPYEEDIKEHRKKFMEWSNNHHLDEKARVRLTIS